MVVVVAVVVGVVVGVVMMVLLLLPLLGVTAGGGSCHPLVLGPCRSVLAGHQRLLDPVVLESLFRCQAVVGVPSGIKQDVCSRDAGIWGPIWDK